MSEEPQIGAHVTFGVQGHGFSYQDQDAFTRRMNHSLSAWADKLENLDRVAPIAFPGWEDWEDAGRPAVPARAAG